MIKPWKPEPGDLGPHRGVTLKPFQILHAYQLAGNVTIDARWLRDEEYGKLGEWIADAVLCRFAHPDDTLAVMYR